jgi:hypothetical protein
VAGGIRAGENGARRKTPAGRAGNTDEHARSSRDRAEAELGDWAERGRHGQTPDNCGSEERAMGVVERAHRNLRSGTQGAAQSAELEGEQRRRARACGNRAEGARELEQQEMGAQESSTATPWRLSREGHWQMIRP